MEAPGNRLLSFYINDILSRAIIGDGDRKSWDARGPMIWDNFSIFRANCAILTSYIHACVVVSRVDVVTLRDQILRIASLLANFSLRWHGIRNQALLCTFMPLVNGKVRFQGRKFL